jgi:hypothetical protein
MDELTGLRALHAPSASALQTLALAAALKTELENPNAPGPKKQQIAEAKLQQALNQLYVQLETAFGDLPPWVDLLAYGLVIPFAPGAIRWAVDHFNTLGLFQGKPQQGGPT